MPAAGRSEAKTGAWVMDQSYLDAAGKKAATVGCAEEVKAWCVYRLDSHLVVALVSLLGTASVTELGAGVGRYARAVTSHNKTLSYTAYDGMPGIEKISHGWVRHRDLANASLTLIPSDFVLTFEMAEHIPRQFQGQLLQSIDRAATRGVIISWGTTKGGVGHVNPMSVSAVQNLFCKRGFHLHSVPTRQLRQSSTYWYFKRNILVMERRPPTTWVDEKTAKVMAAQGTDMRTCGEGWQCCTHMASRICARNVTCMVAQSR